MPEPPESEPTTRRAKLSEERRVTVERARDAWMRRLMDVSRRNNLLYFRDLKTGTLDLSGADPQSLEALIGGMKTPLARLLPLSGAFDPAPRLREIVRKSRSNLEERGLQTLQLAYGMVAWDVGDGGRPLQAAVLLIPVSVEMQLTRPESAVLQREGDPQVNIALLHVLAEDHGIRLDPDEILGASEGEELDPESVLGRFRSRIEGVPGITVADRAVLGNFSFQKLAMVLELRDRSEALASHDVVAALAGDPEAKAAVGGRRQAVEPRHLDRIPPEAEFMVLDADSSQQAVIHAVALEQDGVIQGPPGCGKSQTISNIIATLAAQGKRVLFVAEKRAALEAVYKRLQQRGLGHIALDLHGADLSHRAVIGRIGEAREILRSARDPDVNEAHRTFADRRRRVNEHTEALHAPVAPSGLSPYELQSRLMRPSTTTVPVTRWRGESLERIDGDAARKVEDLLASLSAYAPLFDGTGGSPWTGSLLADEASARASLDAAERIARERLPEVLALFRSLSSETGLRMPETFVEAEEILALVRRTDEILRDWDPAIFGEIGLDVALAPAAKGAWGRLWASLTDPGYRAALKRCRSLSLRGERVPVELHGAAVRAREVTARWREWAAGAGLPKGSRFAPRAAATLLSMGEDLSVLRATVAGLDGLPLGELAARARRLADDEESAMSVPSLRRIEAEVRALGAEAILGELRDGSAPAGEWPALFRRAYLASCYDAVKIAHPHLAAFRGDEHERVARDFKQYDELRLDLSAPRVRRAHAERATALLDAHPEQDGVIRREIAKKSRHRSLRRLMTEAPDALTAICPCWMSSPLNVSQLLPSDREYFDLVIFDEASQVLPEDAVCSILRGRRLVVAGDPHQLPPTTFFASGSEEEDEENTAVEGMESLLDSLSAIVDHWPLNWHYRSRDERLIAFSNRHIYGNRLTTFPGVGGLAAIRHILVDEPPRDGEEDSSTGEVRRVVGLVMEHAREQMALPKARRKSLGVIAMGIKHANRIQASLDATLRDAPDRSRLDEYFDAALEERVFIKNLEQVQGDERDAIILTIGYSKDRNGRLPYRFGPLLQKGGERRLNVAVTRAKERMTVVSSFSHHDMDPNRSDRRGVELLRLYLQFAASEGADLGNAPGTGVAMNPFEADVHDALTARGIPLVSQYGASEYRLDFVAAHPEKPGLFVLAIECDGATYHSAPTARDRDRLRQQQLERAGWRFHRIWSTEWFNRREGTIEAAYEAWLDAVRRYDEEAEDGLLAPVEHPPRESSLESGPPAPLVPAARPPVPARGDVDLYERSEIVRLVRHVRSDGRLRTTEEIVADILPLMGLQRRGRRIVARIEEALEEANRIERASSPTD